MLPYLRFEQLHRYDPSKHVHVHHWLQALCCHLADVKRTALSLQQVEVPLPRKAARLCSCHRRALVGSHEVIVAHPCRVGRFSKSLSEGGIS